MKTVLEFEAAKKEGRKISMVTCYDTWTAKVINQSDVDCILVGDSLAMVMHGHPSTLQATIDMMALHTAAVSKGAPHKFIIADMPFMSFRKSLSEAITAVEKLMQAGAHAVKLEGLDGHEEIVEHIVRSGVPVMGHLGLTPQSVNLFGGFKVQGRNTSAADEVFRQAQELERRGCFSVVLECIPASLASRITAALEIPTIGIGAGVEVDGQVLVLQDMLGAQEEFKPKFLKTYLNLSSQIKEALNTYDSEVKTKIFPTEKESYQ